MLEAEVDVVRGDLDAAAAASPVVCEGKVVVSAFVVVRADADTVPDVVPAFPVM